MSPEKSELMQWISTIVGEPLGTGDFGDILRDGVVLCKLMNRIKPGSCKYTVSRQPFMQMENINSFLDAAREIGVPGHDLFQSIDLFERKNLKQVEICLYAVSRHAQRSQLFGGPFVGPRLADQRRCEPVDEQVKQMNASLPTQ